MRKEGRIGIYSTRYKLPTAPGEPNPGRLASLPSYGESREILCDGAHVTQGGRIGIGEEVRSGVIGALCMLRGCEYGVQVMESDMSGKKRGVTRSKPIVRGSLLYPFYK